jgi:hypothetical protein
VAADAAAANREQSALTIASRLRVFGLILFFLWERLRKNALGHRDMQLQLVNLR